MIIGWKFGSIVEKSGKYFIKLEYNYLLNRI